MNLAIFLPVEYQCSSFVIRKLSRILQNKIVTKVFLNCIDHVLADDIRGFFGIHLEALGEPTDVSHAIVFADSFSLTKSEKDFTRSIPRANIRKISVPVTRVINIKRTHPQEVLHNSKYIGRKTLFGNPYSQFEVGTKEEACRLFRYDFERELLPNGLTNQIVIRELQGRHLACSCKPSLCHGDIYAEFLNRFDHEL